MNKASRRPEPGEDTQEAGHGKRLSSMFGKRFENVDKSDIVKLVATIEQLDVRQWTKHDYKVILKQFYRWLRNCESGETPPEVRWIKASNNIMKKDLLTPDDVDRLIECADGVQEKAFFSVLFDSGRRVGEILGLRIEDIEFDSLGARLRVEGKVGSDTVRICSSQPRLSTWLDNHPERDNPRAPLWIISRKGVVKQRIGVVSEVSNLYNELSAWDNLMFIGELYGIDKLTREARARQLLEAFQLYYRRNDRLLGYSKGMKRRVRIAAALLHSPEVLFLDEPTSGLDVQSSRFIRSIIRELNREGVTVFLTTHYIDEADQLCDRVAIIRQGRIVVEGSPEKLKSSLQGEHVVEVAFDRDAPNLETLPGSSSDTRGVAKRGDKYEIHTSDASITIGELAQFARSDDLKIVSLNTKEPSLEDVFVRHTGLDAVQVERMEFLRAVKGGGQHG